MVSDSSGPWASKRPLSAQGDALLRAARCPGRVPGAGPLDPGRMLPDLMHSSCGAEIFMRGVISAVGKIM